MRETGETLRAVKAWVKQPVTEHKIEEWQATGYNLN